MGSKNYTIDDLLNETITDMENIETDLSSDVSEDLENALEEAGDELKRSPL